MRAATLLLATLLAACGGSNGKAPEPAPAKPAASAATDEAPAKAPDAATPPDAPAGEKPQVRIDVKTKGEGREVKQGDVVLAHLSMSLADGKELMPDTRKKDEPQPLGVGNGRTIPALDQMLAKMRQGDRWTGHIPWQLAFGENGIPGHVPPKSDLVADVEIVGFLDVKIERLQEGSGDLPKIGDTVYIHYAGSTPDGKQFDSSRAKGDPMVLTVAQSPVIEGWHVVLPKLRLGDRVKATIPWQLAYGAVGRPPMIPPKTDLIFDMERVAAPPPPPPPPPMKHDVITEGSGPKVQPGQKVKVHYVGTLTNGTQFDSSRDRKEPFEFQLGAHQVIQGWDEGVAQMRVGDRWKWTIPWQLAYGVRGSPPTIPGKADLVFDIEVLEAK